MRGAILIALMALAVPASAETLREALVRTYNTSPVLAAARARLRSTDEGVPIAKAEARPQLSSTVGLSQSTSRYDRFDNGGRLLTAQANASLPIYAGGRIANAINAADSRVEAGRADLRVTEGDLFTQAVAAYMDVIRDTAIVELNGGQVRVLDVNLRASNDRFQVGDLTRTDVAQSEARLAGARAQLATAQGQLTASREAYRRITGAWPLTLDPPPPLPPLPESADAAVSYALDNSAAIDSVEAGAEAAGFDVKRARAARLPALSATAGTTYNDFLGTRPNFGNFAGGGGLGAGGLGGGGLGTGGFGLSTTGQSRVGVQLTVPLYQGGIVGARVRQAQALQSAALEQVVDTERQVIASARSAYANYLATGETIRSSEQAVSANELALEGARAENGAGTRTVIEVLNAEQELLNSKVQLVTARRNQYVAGFQLLNAMGRAEMRDLGLEGGALYDPVANYKRVRNRIGDWSDDRRPVATSTRTVGPTPARTPVSP